MKRSDVTPFYFLEIKKTCGVPAAGWILLIALLYVLTTIGHFFEIKAFGTMAGYKPGVFILLAPIIEELIFRGVLLGVFYKHFGAWRAIVSTSILFGLWHLKNLLWNEPQQVLEQMVYTGLFFGPILALATVKARSVWPAVVLHYVNNFGSPLKGWMSLLH